MHLLPTNRWKFARSHVGAAFTAIVVLASVSIAAPAGASVTGATLTASGTPGISATVNVNSSTTGVDLHFGVTQPANICRAMPINLGGCRLGVPYQNTGQTYPNWQADLTITGYADAGLTYSSANGGFSCNEASGVLSCHNDFFNNYFKNFDVYFTATSSFNSVSSAVSANLVMSDKSVTDAPPTSMSQCKQGGWRNFNVLSFTSVTYDSVGNYGEISGYLPAWTPSFNNQGDCVSSVVSTSRSTQ